jgi:hypothetical protein
MADKPLKVTRVGPADDRDLAWQKKANELELEALPTLRGTAEKWAASLSGILAAVGLAVLLDGPELFNKLDDSPEKIAKGALFAAVVLGLIATLFATYAAQGTSKRIFLPGSGSLRELSQKAVENAARALLISRIVALAAVIATLVSAWTLMWGAKDPPESKVTEIEVVGCSELGAGDEAALETGSSSEPAYRIRCD